MLNVITNTLALDNEFFIKGSGVYFCGIYEDTLLKGVSPADFHCWHYWGRRVHVRVTIPSKHVPLLRLLNSYEGVKETLQS